MKLLSLTVLAVIVTTSAQAAIFDPAPVKVTNGFSIVPQLETSVSYNDNIYTTEDNLVSSTITISKPSFIFGTDDGINRYGGEYELVAGFYSENSDDNYVDHNLTLAAHTEYTDKHRTDSNADFSNLHEDRGSDLSESESSDYNEDPYKYNTYLGHAYYQYGAESALINVGGGLQYYAKEYQNYSDDTDAYDYSTWTLTLDSDYQVGDVTYLTSDLSLASTVYPDYESKDNTNSTVYLGVRWEGMDKAVGEIKLGYQYKDFDDDSVDDFNGVSTDIGIVWKPLQRSNFELHIIRETEESYNVGDYVLVLSSSLAWTHDWNKKFSSDISLIYSNEDYANADREDDVITTSLDLNYDFTRWFTMTAGYEYADTDSTSNASGIIYTQNVVSLGVTVAL